MIKGSDYVRDRIPPRGPYPDLLRTAGEVIEENTFREFEESFSAENIRSLVAGRVRDYGGDFLRKFGERYRWVNVRVLYDESLAPDEVVLCFREVDAEKQRQLRERHYLEQALDTAQDSLESKQAFFNNMSHDMRTPLNAIIGLTELASRDTADAEKTANYLRRIDQSSHQLLNLINDILEISRAWRAARSPLRASAWTSPRPCATRLPPSRCRPTSRASPSRRAWTRPTPGCSVTRCASRR